MVQDQTGQTGAVLKSNIAVFICTYINQYTGQMFLVGLIITSTLRGGYVIVGVSPSVCQLICLSVNSVIQKLIDGFR